MSVPFSPEQIDVANEGRARSLILDSWGRLAPIQADYQSLLAALPPATAQPDFSMAQGLLAASRRYCAGIHLYAPPEGFTEDFPARSLITYHPTAAQALGIDQQLFPWPPAVADLRERIFAATTPASAPSLAREALAFPDAPWRRWSCASPIAAEMFTALDALGQAEPPLPDGPASLSALMGFSLQPLDSWIGLVAAASSPGSFISGGLPWRDGTLRALSDQNGGCYWHEAPKPLPRGGRSFSVSERDHSTSLLARQAPFESLLWNIIAAPDHVRTMPGSDGSLFAAGAGSLDALRTHPFIVRGLSQAAAELPVNFSHRWPLLAASELPAHGKADPMEVLVAMGACSNDSVSTKSLPNIRVWEAIVDVTIWDPNQGFVVPIDEVLLASLIRGGADLAATRLTPTGSPSEDSTRSLLDYYRAMLDPESFSEAAATVGAVIAKVEREHLDLSTSQAPSLPPKRRSI